MRFVICDVFTDQPLQGNQLAVFTDGARVPEALRQPLAREINFSETVFVEPPADPANTARVRIHVPTVEIPFAGHPVLGTAVVLGAERGVSEVLLETGRGVIPVTLSGSGGTMRQPVPTWDAFAQADRYLRALGLERSELPVEAYDNGMHHVYALASSPDEVAALRPDPAALADLAPPGSWGFNVSAGSGRSWKTRMFAPHDGIAEDPATGSAAGPLACHLARHGLIAWGEEIEISQGAEVGRPSTLYARAEGGPGGITAVQVRGDAVIVGHGEFDI